MESRGLDSRSMGIPHGKRVGGGGGEKTEEGKACLADVKVITYRKLGNDLNTRAVRARLI